MKNLIILLILGLTTIALAQPGGPAGDNAGAAGRGGAGRAGLGRGGGGRSGGRAGAGFTGFGGRRRGRQQIHKYQGLAMTPPMGWNTWNTFGCRDINEVLIKDTATLIASNGLKDAGYVYVVLDDCWMARERDANGQLQADPDKFPSGMKALGDFIHDLGLKYGIYNCAGTLTCQRYPGGRGHEFEDARLYASWGVDYVKYDWCNTGSANPQETYATFGDALLATQRPIILSMCEWGRSRPWEWASSTAQLWRTTGDITDRYSSWKNILDRQVDLAQYAGPDHWNDPDMLEVGNRGLTYAESRAHFSFWCMLAAPLMMGNDLRIMTDDVLKILTDKEVIALDQDPLGKQGTRAIDEQGREVWVKELSDGNWAVCMLNDSPEDEQMSLAWSDIPALGTKTYNVRDLWAKKDLGTTETDYSGNVVSHDVALFRLAPTE
jgi:alpha-galactosidase